MWLMKERLIENFDAVWREVEEISLRRIKWDRMQAGRECV